MEADRLGLRERVRGIALVADSNFLMQIASGLVAPSMILDALEASYTLLVPRRVVEELGLLASRGPRPSVRRLASRALWLLERLGAVVVDVEASNADDAVEALAAKLRGEGLRVVVATSDRALRGRLRWRGIPSLYYRESEGRLELEWEPE